MIPFPNKDSVNFSRKSETLLNQFIFQVDLLKVLPVIVGKVLVITREIPASLLVK